MEFSPGFEAGAQVRKVTLNGKSMSPNDVFGEDVHSGIKFVLTGDDVVRYELTPGLQVLEPLDLPLPGDTTRQLKITCVAWDRTRDRYTIDLEGRSGSSYTLEVLTPRKPSLVEGARWDGAETGGTLTVEFPAAASKYVRRQVILQMPNTREK
jgi:hypothetical protein